MIFVEEQKHVRSLSRVV